MQGDGVKRAAEIASLALRISASLALLAIGLLCAQMREIADVEANNLDSIAQHAVAIEQDTDDTVNELRGSVPKVIHDTRLTLDNANKAAIDERMYFEQEVPGLMARVNTAVDQGTHTLAAYQATGEALTAATERLQPVEDNASASFRDLHTLLTSPDIVGAAKNLNVSSAATAEATRNLVAATGHADAILGDVQFEADKIVHPPKKKLGFWGSIYAGAMAAHKFMPAIF